MNKFLKSANERFDKIKPKDYLINPISEEDCEIVIELMQILKKNNIEDIFQIMNQYKELKDGEIRDTLMQWNIDHPFGTEKDVSNKQKEQVDKIVEEEIKAYAPFIQIGDLTLKIYDLHGFELYERIDKEDNFKYGIKINPTPDHVKSIPLYSNYCTEWYVEQNRNMVLEQLKSVAEEQGTNFIDLNSNE